MSKPYNIIYFILCRGAYFLRNTLNNSTIGDPHFSAIIFLTFFVFLNFMVILRLLVNDLPKDGWVYLVTFLSAFLINWLILKSKTRKIVSFFSQKENELKWHSYLFFWLYVIGTLLAMDF